MAAGTKYMKKYSERASGLRSKIGLESHPLSFSENFLEQRFLPLLRLHKIK